MSQVPIERVLCSPNLPTLPVVAMRVLELTARADVSLREIAAVIENDPAIASKVIRTINSSFYGLTIAAAQFSRRLHSSVCKRSRRSCSDSASRTRSTAAALTR